MRVISQDGTLDFPYEKSVVFLSPRNTSEVRILPIGDDEDGRVALYSTEEKAKKAMEMLRAEFCDYGGTGIFQFPSEEEFE